MERKIFKAVGALVQQIISPTKCCIYVINHIDQPWNAARKPIEIDLDRTPKLGTWNDVLVDDRGIAVDGNPLPTELDPANHSEWQGTSIGADKRPHFPYGASIGAVYLEEKVFADNFEDSIDDPDPEFPWLALGYYSFELMSVVYSSNAAQNPVRAGLRFVGVQGKVEMVAGTVAYVTLYKPGRSRNDDGTPRAPEPDDVVGTFKLDFADPKVIDVTVPAPGEPLLSAAPKTGDVGGFFVALPTFVKLGEARGPKVPIGMG